MKYQIFELRRKIQGYGDMFDYRSYAHHLSSCEIKGWRINAVFISFSKFEIYILYIHLYLHDLREYFELTAWPALRRRGSCPFSKRSMPFSRQVYDIVYSKRLGYQLGHRPSKMASTVHETEISVGVIAQLAEHCTSIVHRGFIELQIIS